MFLSLQGGGLRLIDSSSGLTLYPFSTAERRIDLLPESFQHHSSGLAVSKRDFHTVLNNIERLLLRASYAQEHSAIYRSAAALQASHTQTPLKGKLFIFLINRNQDGEILSLRLFLVFSCKHAHL